MIYIFILFCLFSVLLQITLLPENFSLHFHPTVSGDTAEYICLVNDRHSPEKIIDLLVQGEYDNEMYIDNVFFFLCLYYIFYKYVYVFVVYMNI